MAGPADERRLGYRPALDGLRAVAIGLVVLHHTGAFLVPRRADGLFPGGFLGVDVFFVLSGFLITTLLLERREREPRPIVRFYERRALRLLPAVIVLLLVVAVVSIATDADPGRLPATFLVVLTYTTNWAELGGVDISRYVTHLWSLAIEEQFYIVWPLLLYGALRVARTRTQLAAAAFGLALVFAVWRGILWESGEGWLRIYIRTDARADALLIGATLALLPWRNGRGQTPSVACNRRGLTPPVARSLAGGGALLAVIAIAELSQPSAAWLYLGGLTVVAILVAIAIAAVLPGDSPLTRVLAWTPLVLLGRVSYGLYLWHFPVFLYVSEHMARSSGAARIVVGWTVALGATIASYRLVEQPALALKTRLGLPSGKDVVEARESPAPRAKRERAWAAVPRRFTLAALGGSAVSFVLYLWMLLGGHWTLTRDPGILGGFLDAQGRALLHGRFDVDPATAGFEGFVTDDKTYVYFGPVPSLLRAPVLLVTHSLDGRMTQLSMLAALVVLLAAGAVLQWRVRALLRPGAPLTAIDLGGVFVLQVALGAGAIPLYLASRIVAYHEVEMWGAALALAAMAAIVGLLRRPTVRAVAWAGAFATLAMNTRFSVGLAPVAALGVLAVALALHRTPLRGFAPRVPAADRRNVLVGLVLAVVVPMASYAVISEIKFHQAFGLPLDRQVSSASDPDRKAALAANHDSLFGLKFVPTTAFQAVRPDALGTVRAYPFVGVPRDKPKIFGGVVLDTAEQSLSAPTSMLLFCLLALVGVVALARGPTERRPLLGVLLATLAGFLPSLVIAYIATRYLADLVPFLFLGAAVGTTVLLAASWRRWALAGIAVLAVVGIVVNGATGLVNGRLISAENPIGDRAAFVRTQDDVDGLLGRGRHGVRRGPVLPPTAPGAPGDLFVVGACDGLYVTTLNAGWLPVERTAGDGYHPLALRLPASTGGRFVAFATLGDDPRSAVASVRVTTAGATFSIGVRQGRAVRAIAAGRTPRALVSVDRLGGREFASLTVDGTSVGLVPVAFGPRAALRTTALARALPTPAPVCDAVARRAGF